MQNSTKKPFVHSTENREGGDCCGTDVSVGEEEGSVLEVPFGGSVGYLDGRGGGGIFVGGGGFGVGSFGIGFDAFDGGASDAGLGFVDVDDGQVAS